MLLLFESFIFNNNIVLPSFTGRQTNLTGAARPESSTHEVEEPQKLPTRFGEEPLFKVGVKMLITLIIPLMNINYRFFIQTHFDLGVTTRSRSLDLATVDSLETS